MATAASTLEAVREKPRGVRKPSPSTIAAYKPNLMHGYCHCGCGEKTKLAEGSEPKRGHLKGQPMRFIKGHGASLQALKRENNPNWKGGRWLEARGYVMVRVGHDHPMATKGGTCFEHRLVMSETLGRPLTKDESVHHKNGVRTDNRPENLQLRQGKHGQGVAHICRECGSTNVEAVEL